MCIILSLENIIFAQMILGVVPLPVASPPSSTELRVNCIGVVRVRRAEASLIYYVSRADHSVRLRQMYR